MTKSNKQSLSIETFTHLFSGLSTEHTTYLTKLIEGGVPVDTWGTGERKPLEAFFKELDTGEASLKVLNGKPIRCIRVSAIDIVYTSNQKKKFRLIEARQEFTDSSGAVLTNIDGSQRIK
ncbi:MAG: hypothetical protein KDD56_07140, partial [Bdellovibrionales bacterium]|nr:hypothetical protein [Bdellovibrionales bacterium]